MDEPTLIDFKWVARCPDCERLEYHAIYPPKEEMECPTCKRAMGLSEVK